MRFVNTIETDVIVVGGGLAGLYTALHAAPQARVSLLVKGTLVVSNSMWAQGGISAALAPDDSPALHREDTLTAGRGLCATRAVETLVTEGPAAIHNLLALGVPFDREAGGVLALGLEGGHGRRRIVHADGAATGAAVTRVLVETVRAEPAIALHEQMVAVELLQAEGACVGVLAYHPPTRRWWRFLAPTTILASGGAAGLYARSTNPVLTSGDGVAMAYRAGAAVADMEFIQFHPTGLVTPTGDTFLLSEAIRGEGAHLVNVRGERFMPDYHELVELAPRDVVARAILSEMGSTGADHVLLDLSPIAPEVIRHHFGVLYERCLTVGLDMLREPLPVAPAAHYMMGGIFTDLDGATTVPGLFACGEVACTGVQGANRLASNSLLECLVFGRRSGLAAARQASQRRRPVPAALPLPRTTGAEPRDLATELGHLLWQYAGLVREPEGLCYLLNEVERLEAEQPDPRGQNALLLARLIASAALLRTESRGGHYRADYPEESATWRKRIVFQSDQPIRFLDVEATDLAALAVPSPALARTA